MSLSSFSRRLVTGAVIFSFVLTPFATNPTTVNATGMPVIDGANLVQNIYTAVSSAADHTKEYVLDTLAWQIANLAIESMTKSLVNWINSGFQGSPAFVTDLNQNLRGVGDAVAAQFFKELSMQQIAITPFQDKVLDAVRLGYYLHTSPESFYTRYPYTLNQVSPDARAFLQGDFSQGGWNAWFATVMNPQNNPYGAQLLAEEVLSNTVANATNNRVQELSWNRGFLSWRGECKQMSDHADAIELSGADPCVSYQIETPGSVIMEQLNTQLGSGVNRLVSADEFNEIIGALLNQLVLQVVGGGNGGGLRGVSRPSAGGGTSFIDQPTTNPTSSIGGTFTATIQSQRRHITNFQTGWQRLQQVANAASTRCPVAQDPNPRTISERSAQSLVRAANVLAALSSIESRIAAAEGAGGNQSVNFLGVAEEYNALISSSDFPTETEMAEVVTQSEDSGDAEPPSLYTQLMRMSQGSCSSAGT